MRSASDCRTLLIHHQAPPFHLSLKCSTSLISISAESCSFTQTETESGRFRTISIRSETPDASITAFLDFVIQAMAADGVIALVARHKRFPVRTQAHLFTTGIAYRNSRLHHFRLLTVPLHTQRPDQTMIWISPH